MEPNDTILLAELIELNGSSPIEVTISGEIGDNPDVDPNDDVDLYEINLIADDVVSLDIDARSIDSNLNPVLTVFDVEGNLRLQNDNIRVDGVIDFDSFLNATVLQDGTFYVGVSSARNLSYDPTIAGSGSGNTSGIYDLTFTVEREVETTEPNDIISSAEVIELDRTSPTEITAEIGDNPDVDPNNDVDLYEISLAAGDIVSIDIDAQVIDSDLNSVLTIFDADGELLFQNNNTLVDDGVISLDSFQQFTAPVDANYYVGVSSSSNLNYDPNLADSGVGNSSGVYELTLTLESEPETTEPNDTILLAEVIELDSATPVTIDGEIGDNPDVDPDNDVDLYEISLAAGDIVSIDIDAQVIDSDLNSVLTIFDADGELLFQNNNTVADNGVISLDSFLPFTAPEDANYYVGVSSSSNLNYDPNLADSGVGNSSGVYELTLTLESEPEIGEPNDIISSAEVVELDSTTPVSIDGEIGDNPDVDATNDVDLFAVELNAGDTILADINAEINDSELDSVLTIFGANGNVLVQNDDNSFEDFSEPDSFQQFTALLNGTYYIGVSSSENLEYDPTEADSGVGDSSGVYELVLTYQESENENPFYSEPNDTILLADSVELDAAEPVVIFGEIGDNTTLESPDNDVDLFAVELSEGANLSLNLDAEAAGSSLNSVLTIFDADGELLRQNDDNSFEDFTELDSFLDFTAPVDGTYYVGVSSSENLEYDPTEADSGVGDSSGSYSLELTLTLDENLFDTPITRFQNSDRPGTYLFAGPEESEGIRDNFPNFEEEGVAFQVATEPGDDLIRFNRFQNSDVPGTYLYAGEEESISIRANFPQFIEEGIAFYTYNGSSDVGEDFYRFQNLAVPGTYIFVAGEERLNILANFPDFEEEGVAFKVEI
ncbi:MAG: DVUA0089 family protein [Cyanobacteria bacterium P01_F01_bin.143]